MAPGCRDLQGAPAMDLAAHIGQIQLPIALLQLLLLVRLCFRYGGDRGGGSLAFARALQPVQGSPEIGGRPDGQLVHQGGFAAIGRRQQQRPGPRAPGGQCQGQGAAHRSQRAIETQLAGTPHTVQRSGIQLAAGRQHRQGDRQIKGRALLALVCRREVDDHPRQRHLQAAVAQRGPHPLT